MNAYRHYCITRPLMAEIRTAIVREYRRIRAGNPAMARMIYRETRRRKMALQDMLTRNLMLATHVAGISNALH